MNAPSIERSAVLFRALERSEVCPQNGETVLSGTKRGQEFLQITPRRDSRHEAISLPLDPADLPLKSVPFGR